MGEKRMTVREGLVEFFNIPDTSGAIVIQEVTTVEVSGKDQEWLYNGIVSKGPEIKVYARYLEERIHAMSDIPEHHNVYDASWLREALEMTFSSLAAGVIE